jgi:hypothetical protein
MIPFTPRTCRLPPALRFHLVSSEPSPFGVLFQVKYACSIPEAHRRVNNLFEKLCVSDSRGLAVQGSAVGERLSFTLRLSPVNRPYTGWGVSFASASGRPKPDPAFLRPAHPDALRRPSLRPPIDPECYNEFYNERMNQLHPAPATNPWSCGLMHPVSDCWRKKSEVSIQESENS